MQKLQKILFLFVMGFSVGGFPQILGPIMFHKAATSYYCRSITIDHTKVPGTLTDFPVLVSGTYSYLATVANGGKVQNSSGYDVRFYGTSDCSGTALKWETETYTAASGLVNYWVKVASVSSSTDTVFSVRYGESGITTDQSDKNNVWDSDFKGVWHLKETTTNYTDSTSNAHHWTTGTNPTQVTGQVGYGQSYNGSTQYNDAGSNWVGKPTVFTVSHWINLATTQTARVAFGNFEPVIGWVTGISDGSNNKLKFYLGSGTLESATALSNSTWYLTTFVYNSGSVAIYINQNVDATGSITVSYPAGAFTVNNTLGMLGGFAAQFLNGSLDEVRYSTTNRSANWITADYNNQSSPSTFYTVGSEVAH